MPNAIASGSMNGKMHRWRCTVQLFEDRTFNPATIAMNSNQTLLHKECAIAQERTMHLDSLKAGGVSDSSREDCSHELNARDPFSGTFAQSVATTRMQRPN